MLFIGASSIKTATYYAQTFGISDAAIICKPTDIVMCVPGEDEIIYVNDDAGPHNIDIVRSVELRESLGVNVEWVGGVPDESDWILNIPLDTLG